MGLGDITRDAVLRAIDEYDQLGQDEFLLQYGFDHARRYVLVHDGKRYDSKAIVGVAHRFLPGQDALAAGEFSGGKATVGQLLGRLGFRVEEGDEQPVEASSVIANADGSTRPQGSRPGDWTEVENRAIVDDYLAMLALECAGQPYSKTGQRNALIESMGATRSPARVLALTAAIWHNDHTGQPAMRALTAYGH